MTKIRHDYEHVVAEWSAVESIVRERDKEAFLAGKYTETIDISVLFSTDGLLLKLAEANSATLVQ